MKKMLLMLYFYHLEVRGIMMLEYNENHVKAFVPTIKKARFKREIEFNPNHIKAYDLMPLNSKDYENLENGMRR